MKYPQWAALPLSLVLLGGAVSLSGCSPADIPVARSIIRAIAGSSGGAAGTIDTAYAQSLMSPANGPGLFVAQPVGAEKDADLANFGAGCGRWLHLYASGQLNMDRTPSWSYADAARIGLQQPDFRVTPSTVGAWATALGGIDVAAGHIAAAGSGPKAVCTLSYQVYGPDGKPVGNLLEATGTEDAIVSQLPALAQKLDAAVGVTPNAMPKSADLSAAQLATLGGLPWHYHYPEKLTAIFQHSTWTLADSDPLAALLLLQNWSLRQGPYMKGTIGALMHGAPQNGLAISTVAEAQNIILHDYDPVVHPLIDEYPKNYLLGDTCYYWNRTTGDITDEQSDAERAVTCAPANAEGWVHLQNALMENSEAIRHGVYWTALSSSQRDILSGMYAKAQAVSEEAVTVNPRYALAWEKLSSAAAHNGNLGRSEQAILQGAAVDPLDRHVYDWGIEVSQPKWNDQPGHLLEIAQGGAANSANLYIDCQKLKYALDSIQRSDALPGLLQEIEKNDPMNPSALTESGMLAMYGTGHNYVAATTDFTKAVTSDPLYAEAYVGLGNIDLWGNHNAPAAEKLIRKGISLDSTRGWFHTCLAQCLQRENRQDEAQQETDLANRLGNY